MLNHNSKLLLPICKLLVADAYFSKESFVTGVKTLGFDLVSRFRDDVRLRYLYSGPKTHKRGRPQKYAGKVDLKNLDMSVFEVDYTVVGNVSLQNGAQPYSRWYGNNLYLMTIRHIPRFRFPLRAARMSW